jgi:hypothetical protein
LRIDSPTVCTGVLEIKRRRTPDRWRRGR